MSDFYMLGRLLWRPVGWLVLVTLAIVSFAAGLDMAHGPQDLVSAGLYGEASRDQRLAFWRLATMVPAIAGLALSLSARELQHTFFAWTLPGLSRGLRGGKAVFGATAAILMTLLAARMQGPEIASAAFGWALLCFVLGGVASDPLLPKVESKGVTAILVLVVLGPDFLEQAILVQPVVFAAVATIASWVLLQREFSTALSRKRPLVGVPPAWAGTPHGTRQFWSRSSAPSREWNETLANDRFAGWLRAGYYEAYGGVRRGWGLLQIGIAMAIAYLIDDPQVLAVASWVVLGTTATQLRSKFLYPVSRPRRAALFFSSTVLETFAIAAIALGAVTALLALGTQADTSSSNSMPGELAAIFAFFVVWAPLGHWAKIREGWTGETATSLRLALRFFGFHAAYIILAMVSVYRFRKLLPTSWSAWIVIGLLGAAVYAIYWLAIQWHFARSDLVVAR